MTRPSGDDLQLDLRAKPIARVLVPAVWLGWAAASVVVLDGWRAVFGLVIGGLVGIGSMVELSTSRLVVVDGRLFIRYYGWHHVAVVLGDLSWVAYEWRWPGRELPRRTLCLRDTHGARAEIYVRHWAGWRRLIDCIARESGLVPTGPDLFPIRYRPTAAVPRRA